MGMSEAAFEKGKIKGNLKWEKYNVHIAKIYLTFRLNSKARKVLVWRVAGCLLKPLLQRQLNNKKLKILKLTMKVLHIQNQEKQYLLSLLTSERLMGMWKA
jgi:hypothetical protein